MLSSAFERGNCVFAVKSGLNQGIVGTAFFKLLSSFYTSRGGGSEAPIRRLAGWGLLLKLHRTSLEEKIKLQYSCMFLRLLFLQWLVRAVAHFNSFRNGAKKFNNSNESKIRRFQPVGEAAETLSGFVKNWLKLWGDDAPSKTCLRLPIGETFACEANGTRGAFLPRQQVVFITDF